MKNSLNLFLSLITLLSFGITSCNKNDDSGATSTLQVRLTDAPTSLDSVNIDIKEVRVLLDNDTTESGWRTMDTNAGIYNLLDLQNGVDTLIGTLPTLQSVTVKQIRFVLGSGNYVVDNGISYPLTIPSGSESGLKVMVNKHLAATLETILIDFDAAASIRQEQNGDYKLRPVLIVR